MASESRIRTLTVFAPAKVNLFLHITGRQDNGYHELESLMAFADIGDRLSFTSSDNFSFYVGGAFADGFSAAERDASPDSSNLVVRAVWELARILKREPQLAVKLDKTLPLAAGIGGGSSDAASALWGLLELWDISAQAVPGLDKLMLGLGADVPACFACRPVLATGIGDKLQPVNGLPELPVVLVNPGKACSTGAVFKRFDKDFSRPVALPESFTLENLIEFLSKTENMLTRPAIELVPEITDTLDLLAAQDSCALARLSGSGATCFGLFEDSEAASNAAEAISARKPEWWVRAGTLNRPERY